jgi:hypothetical protein
MTITINGTTGINAPNLTIDSGGTVSTTALTASTINGSAYSPYTGFKNRIINPKMAVDQRNVGSSQTITAAAALAYTVDRWYAYCTGANVTGQRVAGAYTSSQYQYQFTGAASVTAIGFGQRIETANSYDLANTTATLSCYISNSLLTTVTWTASYATTTDTFGTLASPTVTQIATGTFTVSSTRTQYTTNISIPAAAITGIQIVFTVGAQTSGTWIIDTVQLEAGSTASTFEYRSIGQELLMCQRYYQKSYTQTVALGTITRNGAVQYCTFSNSATGQNNPPGFRFAVPMRVAATVTSYDPDASNTTATARYDAQGLAATAGAASVGSVGDSGVGQVSVTTAGRTTGASLGVMLHFTASAEL